MSDIGVAEIPVDEDERPLPPPEAPVKNALVEGPILRTLLWLAWPNVIALSAGTCVVIAETSYIGRLGVESLAAMALVFPVVILTMTMSGGAMGGGVASAVARALGAGDVERASTLAAHALLIGLCFGLTFMLGMLIFGPKLLEVCVEFLSDVVVPDAECGGVEEGADFHDVHAVQEVAAAQVA